MPGVEIHNGEVLVNGVPEAGGPEAEAVLTPPGPKAKSAGVEDINPEDIAARMANTISLGIENKLTPMEIVNSLLTLNSAKGHKLVWTRFDVHQTFALWAKKLDGRGKL